MSDVLKIIGGVTVIAGIAFALPLLGVVVGAFSGWVVGLIFPHTFHAVREALHIGPIAPWQLGAMLGWAGSFVRSTSTETKKK